MNILGVSAGFHDAAISVINTHGDILFAGHSERYSKVKNDPDICKGLMDEIREYNIDTIAYYEQPLAKQLRQLYSGQGVEWNKLTAKNIIYKQCAPWLPNKPKHIKSYNHHLSHAAAGFQTSSFDRATVVVIDAIGEWDTISIYGAEYVNGRAKYKKLWGQRYPHSIGLFYSAMTQRVGLKPNEDEYILMGMSAYGVPFGAASMQDHLVLNEWESTFKDNLHIGVGKDFFHDVHDADIAAAAQKTVEKLIYNIMRRARDFAWSTNLVYMGGVALNCLANRNLGEYFENIWIMPNPGDAGSSLGAAALAYGGRINWTTAYLGHSIAGTYPVNSILDSLLANNIVGVASGKAEFGPRALGNRSLLADPRGADIKDRVNEIKRRQKFRPFAPVILAEMADQYFDFHYGWSSSPYMQSVALCKFPDDYPAICHVDGTSRVQTVEKDGSGIRELLEKWYLMTDCPMLLNTSLNIKGEPMVNDRTDADRFEELYGIKVYS
ncbi:COG2192 Predicted carbamoyl transferase, NodU family [uncultured Caudovirales phage]|uniref:COG2192 Predicted carbamoyl transferase, NodU family n=1 Tax=uncultured Caudovirales phage TaxID=2100421 RepID=A0A6J5LKT7_9CAUD|nr:COG2192 Predicted carbamoyl transferase, NodU family [uncultured Caudovirales phage]